MLGALWAGPQSFLQEVSPEPHPEHLMQNSTAAPHRDTRIFSSAESVRQKVLMCPEPDINNNSVHLPHSILNPYEAYTTHPPTPSFKR